MKIFKNQITDIISSLVDLDKETIFSLIEIPPNSDMGDYAFPCFQLAKIMKQSPTIVASASELSNKIIKNDNFEKINNVGPYINFYVNKNLYIKKVIDEIQTKKDTYGSSLNGKNKKMLIEHTSINPNASPHIGRTRNAFIGDSIARLYKFEGYNVDVHYFVNDIGKQIAMLLLGSKDKSNVDFSKLLSIYVDINDKVKENPELEKEAFNLLYKLENGEETIVKEFRDIVNICIEGQSAIFSEIGINSNSYDYESY